MKGKEVLQALIDGKKIRVINWPKGEYIFMDDDHAIAKKEYEGVTGQFATLEGREVYHQEWEVFYKKEFLEKEIRKRQDDIKYAQLRIEELEKEIKEERESQ